MLRHAQIAVIVVCLVGLITAVVIGRLLARSVLRPLRALQDGAERLGAGD